MIKSTANPHAGRQLPNLGSLWMLLAALGFALMGALVKLGATKFSVSELVFYRSLFGLIAITLYLRRQKLSLASPVLLKQLSRALLGFASLLLFFYAIAHLPLATAITLNYTSPLFLAMLAPFLLQEPLKKTLMLALIIGFVGVSLLLKPTLSSSDGLAGSLGLLSGLGAAWAYVQVKQLAKLNEPDTRTVFYFTLLSTLLSGTWMLLAPQIHRLAGMHTLLFAGFHGLTWQDLPLLIGLGASATIAQLAMTRAYRTGDTLVVASLAYATVLLASLLGVIFWGEQLSPNDGIAIFLIVLSGLISLRSTPTAK